MLSFNNTEIAFSGKTNNDLNRSYWLFRMVSNPTFVNIGNKETIKGDTDLFIIKLKAKRNVTFNLKLVDGLLVDKALNKVRF